jgi:soluble lytic murein transglycosylase
LKKRNKRIFKVLIILIILLALIPFSKSLTGTVLKHFYPLTYSEYVEKYSVEYGVDKNLVYSVIKAESGFDPKAVSPREAKGLMQILDSTGEWAAEKIKIENFENSMLLEPETNIRIGCWYIARLLKQYNQDIELALAAYNAGSGNVSKWLKDNSISSDGKTLDRIPFEETENYVGKIKKYNNIYKRLYGNEK